MNLTIVQVRWLTFAFILVVTIAVIGYDLIAIHLWGVEASISRVLRRCFVFCPTLFVAFVFWLGILVGHIGLPTE